MNGYWQKWREQGRALTLGAWGWFTLALIGHWTPPHIPIGKIIVVGGAAATVTAMALIFRRMAR